MIVHFLEQERKDAAKKKHKEVLLRAKAEKKMLPEMDYIPDTIRRKYESNAYDMVIGLDPGYKTIADGIRLNSDGSEQFRHQSYSGPRHYGLVQQKLFREKLENMSDRDVYL